ncbi:uncharacterized protein LOC106086567 isoform X1 [Stomoxys calcitrans]|uniref:uncharacterized protein LOC106086567 isoform X1 n=1 Tax=Stomoxys calcitrans TaxID=35570 RepID=UPI0027E374FD|nr:uncharacterized protein LOC106086567 isoform X1 [Stomoxys calcitrans]
MEFRDSFFVTLVILLTSTSSKILCYAIVCYKCDSISLEACATSLNVTELPYENCPSASLQCTMSIVDSITYRGCSSTTPSIGATYSKKCNTNLCNVGVYPPGRMKCYQCSDVSCASSPQGKPHPCRYHQEVDQCYLDIRSATEVYRGCRSDTNHTMANTVIYCDYNGCNEDSAFGKLKCAYCDSKLSLGCKRDLMTPSNITQFEMCEMDMPLNGNNSCFLYRNVDHVVRGCSDRHITNEIKLNMKRVTNCTNKDFCNTGNLPLQQCLQCNSELGNDNCRYLPTSVSKSVCGAAEASSCYAQEFVNWHVQRGCARAPQRNDVNRQYECDDRDDCNATPFIRCYKCSTESNKDCGTWQKPGFLQIEECQQQGANCLIAKFKNGVTERGCENEHFNCSLSTVVDCQQCQGSFCNRNTYPTARLLCYQCGSESNDCSKVLAQVPLPCPQSELEPVNGGKSECFEYFNNPLNRAVRGCASNSTEYYRCMLQSKSGCRLCSTDGCNNQMSRLASD